MVETNFWKVFYIPIFGISNLIWQINCSEMDGLKFRLIPSLKDSTIDVSHSWSLAVRSVIHCADFCDDDCYMFSINTSLKQCYLYLRPNLITIQRNGTEEGRIYFERKG